MDATAPRRPIALLALALAGCNALLGLGESPTADDEASSTATTTGGPATTSGTGAGGEGASSASTGDGGHGGGGAAGAGGDGGGDAPTPPCGPCDGEEACGPGGSCVEGACTARVLVLEGGGAVVQGIAVSPTTIVVGAADDASNATFHFVERATWGLVVAPPENVPTEGVLAPGPEVRAYYTPAGAQRILPIDPEGFAGPIEVGAQLRGVRFDPGPTPAGSLIAAAFLDGQLLRIDLDPAQDVAPCVIAPAQGDTADDVAVRRDERGAVTAIAWSLSGQLAAPSRAETLDPSCGASDDARAPIDEVDALATIAMGDGAVWLRAHRTGDPAGAWVAISTSLDAAGRPTNDRWGLEADGDHVLVPGVVAGLDRCDADLVTCADAAPDVPLGAVQDVAIAGDALLITDVVGSEARLVCLARSGAAPP